MVYLNFTPNTDKMTIIVQNKSTNKGISGSVVRISDIITKDTIESGVTDSNGVIQFPLSTFLRVKISQLSISVTSTSFKGTSVQVVDKTPQVYNIKLEESVEDLDEIVIVAPKPKPKPKPEEIVETNNMKKWIPYTFAGLGLAVIGYGIFKLVKK
jgi:hypothetical protein